MTGKAENPELERLLADYAPYVADLTRRARTGIMSAMPGASERVYFGWRGVGFHHPAAGYVCAIFPGAQDIKIGFEHGNLLQDPEIWLEGNGKQIRYLTVTEWNDSLSTMVAGFIDQAVRVV